MDWKPGWKPAAGWLAVCLLAAAGTRAAAEDDPARLARENGELRAQLAAREAALALALTNAPVEIRLRTALLELQQAFDRFTRERDGWAQRLETARTRAQEMETERERSDRTWAAALQASRSAEQSLRERLQETERRLRDVEAERDAARRKAREADRLRLEKDAVSERLLAREKDLDALRTELRQARSDARRAAVSGPPSGAVDTMQAALAAGQWPQAAEAAATILRKDARNPDARRGLAAARLGAGDVRGALEILEDLIREDAQHPDSLLLSARAWSAAGNLEAAVDRYARAVDRLTRAGRKAETPALLKEWGQAEYELGRLSDAESRFRDALAARPDDAESHFNLAAVLLSQPNPNKEEAGRHYSRALELGEPRDEDLEKRLR